ncbi:MAG: DMT family transporter [Rhodospirillum sp.]|nr:DMT family transporter [Rhodospirillum sp.]MCF8487941.1 DMT family transporter [Rhodospirillum sp.]MCF8499288.1 DMT family transporter [Rhodospirillum sp.]
MGSPLLYVLTVLIWGSTWFAIVHQLGVVDPVVSLIWRFGLAGIIMLVFSRLTEAWIPLSRRAHLWIGAQGFCLFSGNYLLFYWATGLLPSGLVAVVMSSIVGMNILFGALFFGRPVDRRVLAGAILGLFGIVCIFLPEMDNLSLADGGTRGLALCLMATVLASFGNLLAGRNQRAGIPVARSTALGMGYGTAFLVLLALVQGLPFRFDFHLPYILSLLYLIFLGSVVAFWCYLTLLGRIGADRAAYAMVLFPVVALGLSTVLEGYQWTAGAGVGLLLVSAGNVIVLRKPKPKASVPPKPVE